jgi:hypothetical protein
MPTGPQSTQNMVNPLGELGVGTNEEFPLVLSAKSGRFEGVSYQTPKNELPGRAWKQTTCTFEGHTVFEVEFGVTFTASDIEAAR